MVTHHHVVNAGQRELATTSRDKRCVQRRGVVVAPAVNAPREGGAALRSNTCAVLPLRGPHGQSVVTNAVRLTPKPRKPTTFNRPNGVEGVPDVRR